MRFLVVEDDEVVAEVLRQMLEDLGHEVVGTAGSATLAYGMIEALRPDALLVDVELDGIGSGIDVASYGYVRWGIRSIFVSGHIDGWLMKEMAAVRPYAFIAKPFMPEKLADTVKRIA
ncbi:response regulator [Arenibaculum pallidiluteum]|uniref:response regulator n=1 Tax=Arenibaculum pallidiluteum TaxID=2812559 RepID=UPI001A9626A7|nr:response regulator [Arenibaculum pallidiluteum]